jgi:hypothetical protein
MYPDEKRQLHASFAVEGLIAMLAGLRQGDNVR